MASSAVRALCASLVVVASWGMRPASADEHPGAVIYREHCLRCHGENGVGTPAASAPLVGDRSIGQLWPVWPVAGVHEAPRADVGAVEQLTSAITRRPGTAQRAVL